MWAIDVSCDVHVKTIENVWGSQPVMIWVTMVWTLQNVDESTISGRLS